MKNRKRFFCLLTLALLSLALLAGCGSPGRAWRDTGVIDDYGTVTRNGEQIDVCVTHDQKAVYLYYDDEDHKLFDTAMLPADEIYDKDWLLGNISFSDFTGDNNSDLQVYLEHADMRESYLEWTWEEGAGYVYRPDYSWFYEPIVVRDPPDDAADDPPDDAADDPPDDAADDPPDDAADDPPGDPPYEDTEIAFSMYEGVWLGDADNLYGDMYIEFDWEGCWQLYSGGDAIDEGYLWYDTEWDTTCIYSYQGGAIDGGQVELEGGRLSITTLGYFTHAVSEDDSYSDDDSGNGDYGDDFGVYHRDISDFAGTWYYDNDLSAETYIIIDGYGNWSYYQRTPGDAEGTEMDCGTFSYAPDESGTYYADSIMYDGVRFRMYDQDEGVLLWDGDTYYRME